MSNVTQKGLMEELEHYAKVSDMLERWERLGEQIIERWERLGEQIIALQDRVAELERRTYCLEDDIRNVRYTAEDAQSKAESAQRDAEQAQRGW